MRLAPSKPDRFVVECVLQALRKRYDPQGLFHDFPGFS